VSPGDSPVVGDPARPSSQSSSGIALARMLIRELGSMNCKPISIQESYWRDLFRGPKYGGSGKFVVQARRRTLVSFVCSIRCIRACAD
jgi:hypothetical protein